MGLEAAGDVRYQVFVAATDPTLDRQRSEVAAALARLGCVAVGPDLVADLEWAVVAATIDDSDYFLAVIGDEEPSDDTARGFVERALEYSVASGTPSIALVHAERAATSSAAGADHGLAQLVELVERAPTGTVATWRSGRDLGAEVAAAVDAMMTLAPGRGWLPASEAITTELLDELTGLATICEQIGAPPDPVAIPPWPDIDRLQQGDDQVELSFVIEPPWEAGSPNKVGHGKVSLSWRSVFFLVASEMLTATGEPLSTPLERPIEGHLQQLLLGRQVEYRDKWGNRFSKVFADGYVILDRSTLRRISCQLVALRLIEPHPETHVLSVWWSLTPRGRAYANEIGAARGDRVRSDRWKRQQAQPDAEASFARWAFRVLRVLMR